MSLLTLFHDNIKHGILFPVWAAELQQGFGEPRFEFLPPLHLYVAELAGPYAPFLFLALAATGAWALVLRLYKRHAVAMLGAATYALSPSVVHGLIVPRALSELATLAALPWFALGLVYATERPRRAAWAAASIAVAALTLCRPGLLLVLVPFAALARVASIPALALGLGAGAFHWLPALLEAKQIRPIASIETYSRLDQLAVGAPLPCLGALWALSRLSCPRELHPQAKRSRAVMLFLLVAIALSLYLSHGTSRGWHELLPPLAVLSFQQQLPLLLALAGALLVSLAALEHVRRRSHWAIVWMAVAAVLAAGNLAAKRSGYTHRDDEGTIPVTAATLPDAPASDLLEFKQGRGEADCLRKRPTLIECEVMAIRASTLALNVLDFPQWLARVDGVETALAGRDPLRGVPLVNVSPGKHTVALELVDTRERLTAKLISLVAWVLIAWLLFQDQFAKAKSLAPKRR